MTHPSSQSHQEASSSVADDQAGLRTHREAARYLSLSERKLYEIADRGDVPRIRIDGCYRYAVEDLSNFVASRRTRTASRVGAAP